MAKKKKKKNMKTCKSNQLIRKNMSELIIELLQALFLNMLKNLLIELK